MRYSRYYLSTIFFLLGNHAYSQSSYSIFSSDREGINFGIEYSDLLKFGFSTEKSSFTVRNSTYVDKIEDQVLQFNYYRQFSLFQKQSLIIAPVAGSLISYDLDYNILFIGAELGVSLNNFNVAGSVYSHLRENSKDISYQIGCAYQVKNPFGFFLNYGTTHVFDFDRRVLELGFRANENRIDSKVFLQLPEDRNLYHTRLFISIVYYLISSK